MPLKDVKYKRDQTILKVYGYGENKKIKVIRMNWLRTAGVEDDEEYRAPKGSVNDFKLEENIQRAKFLSTLSLRRATAKVHKTVGHFCAYETNFMEIASSC